MRVQQLLKHLNISLDTLNQELIHMHYPQVNLNSKLSDNDYVFLSDYFASEEMRALTYANLEVAKCRHKLDVFFLKDFKPIDQLGNIEKLLYFKWIINYGHQFLSFQTLFPNAVSLTFSEDVFEKLYKWYDNWKSKDINEREQEENDALDLLIDNKPKQIPPIKTSIDEETAIMSALKHGYGDVYGF